MNVIIRALIIDDATLMKEVLNLPSLIGRMQNDVFMHWSQQGHGNQCLFISRLLEVS